MVVPHVTIDKSSIRALCRTVNQYVITEEFNCKVNEAENNLQTQVMLLNDRAAYIAKYHLESEAEFDALGNLTRMVVGRLCRERDVQIAGLQKEMEKRLATVTTSK